jgi:hypothetical protein
MISKDHPCRTLFEFEHQLGLFTGAPYVVVTDGCTHAIELCMRYDQVKACSFVHRTYLSIPMLMHQLDISYTLVEKDWLGEYQFEGTRIWDSARLLSNGMYRYGQMQCLSFGHGKPLELGKVGAILLDDYKAYRVLSMMRSDGRDLNIKPWESQQVFDQGYHYCPSLEHCALGIEKLKLVDQEPKYYYYPDLREVIIK